MDLTTMKDACATTERVVAGISANQLELATPCTEWDVHALLNHLLGTLSLGTALLGGTMPAVEMAPGGQPARDLVGDAADGGIVGAYRTGVDTLLAAGGGDALQRVHDTPLGAMPGAVLAGHTTLDILVHGWDLATATGQQHGIDERLAEQVLAFARQAIPEQHRAPRIGPEVAVAATAPATDRLVAFLGRHP
jgi:uncharacterized protein (TIGR03086 family)